VCKEVDARGALKELARYIKLKEELSALKLKESIEEYERKKRKIDFSKSPKHYIGLLFEREEEAKKIYEIHALLSGNRNYIKNGNLFVENKENLNTVSVLYESKPVNDALVLMHLPDEGKIILFEKGEREGEYCAKTEIPKFRRAIILAKAEMEHGIQYGLFEIKGEDIKKEEEEEEEEGEKVRKKGEEEEEEEEKVRKREKVRENVESRMITPPGHFEGLIEISEEEAIIVFNEISREDDKFIVVKDCMINLDKVIEELDKIAVPQKVIDYLRGPLWEDINELAKREEFRSLREKGLEEMELRKIKEALGSRMRKKFSDNYYVGKKIVEFVKDLFKKDGFGILGWGYLEKEICAKFELNLDRAWKIISNLEEIGFIVTHHYIIWEEQMEAFISERRREGLSDKDIYKEYVEKVRREEGIMPPELQEILERYGVRERGE